MTNLLQKYNESQIERLSKGKETPDFRAGDVVRVRVKISDGATERVQAFEGLCIARKSRGQASSFTVRKISHGEGVERIFPLYSPRIEGIDLVRQGVVRRAKLYYMRELTGKAARIKEKLHVIINADSEEALAKAAEKKAAKAQKKAAKAEKKAAPKAVKKERKPKKKAESK
jgi:large subunit ribosomal protein L19